MTTSTPKTSLYGGWPLTPSKVWPGETALTCPACFSQDVTIKTEPGAFGTAPGGRWRMGDRGGRDVAVCKCGNKGYHQGDKS